MRINKIFKQTQNIFSPFGTVDKVKKISNYSFIHFATREEALQAMTKLNNTFVDSGELIAVDWSKPEDSAAKLKRLQRKQARSTVVGVKTFSGHVKYHYTKSKGRANSDTERNLGQKRGLQRWEKAVIKKMRK